MGCTVEEKAELEAGRAFDEAVANLSAANAALEKAVAAPIEGVLEIAEGIIDRNAGKAAGGAKRAWDAAKGTPQVHEAVGIAGENWAKAGNAHQSAIRAFKECLAKEKNEKRPKKTTKPPATPTVVDPWSGYIKCVIEASADKVVVGDGGVTETKGPLAYREEQTWTIEGGQTPGNHKEYVARWTYSVVGSDHLSSDYHSDDDRDNEETITWSGEGDRASTLAIEWFPAPDAANVYMIAGQVRHSVGVILERHKNTNTKHPEKWKDYDENIDLSEEYIQYWPEPYFFVSATGDTASEQRLLEGTKGPVKIQSRHVGRGEWTRTWSWKFRR